VHLSPVIKWLWEEKVGVLGNLHLVSKHQQCHQLGEAGENKGISKTPPGS
jgi:hypothetical protein